MLYASTIATLKREFGLTYITQELRASSINEMTIKSFQQHVRTQAAPPPRTMREEEMMEIHQREVSEQTKEETKMSFSIRQRQISASILVIQHCKD